MRSQTIFVANDGSRWDTAEQALARDALIVEVDRIMAPMGKRPEGSDFANGAGCIQHVPATLALVRSRLYEASRPALGWWYDDQKKRHGREPVDAHASWFTRMLDGKNGPLSTAWYRFQCIDQSGREWGQPYFANNPDQAEDSTPINLAAR